ncbi:MAG: hypothetical protein R3Y14_00005 [Rikenellaceae bacterium]
MKNRLSTIALYTLLVGTIMSCQQRRPELQLCDASNFETSINGDKVSLYTLRNSVGTTMQVTNYGARVVSLWCEDRDGNWADIVL